MSKKLADERHLTVLVTANHFNILSPEEWQQRFNYWVDAIPPGLSPIEEYEVGLTLTDDETIRELNRTYRHQDQSTDVLAFADLETSGPTVPELLEEEPLYLGDIIISIETAQQQATAAGQTLTQETVWLATHGFLHLLGWDHPDHVSLTKMLARQQELLETFPAVNQKSS